MPTTHLTPPAPSSPYTEDDATTNRVLLAFADLHATLRNSADGKRRWEPAYHRVPDGTDWAVLRQQLDAQAQAAGWQADDHTSEQGPGYVRRIWRTGNSVVAAALVKPPEGSDGATVLVLLEPRR